MAFPPLCLGAASETVEEAAQAGRFTDDQAALMTGETQGYVLKFKAIELWEGLKRLTGVERERAGEALRPPPRLSFAKDSMNLLHGTIYNLTLEKMY